MAANPTFAQTVLDAYLATAPVFKAMLVDSDYAPDMTVEVDTSVATAHEIPGVARVDLTGVGVSGDETEASIKSDPVVFLALADGVTDVGGIVIYDDSRDQIVSWDLDEGPFDPPAGDLTYTVDPTTGFVVLTV